MQYWGWALSPLTPVHGGGCPSTSRLSVWVSFYLSSCNRLTLCSFSANTPLHSCDPAVGRASHIIPPSTALIIALPCPSFSPRGFDPSTLFSSAGLRRDRFFFATTVQLCTPAVLALVRHPGLPLRLTVLVRIAHCSCAGTCWDPRRLLGLFAWSGAQANCSLLRFSAIRALAPAPTQPLTPRQRPG